MNVKKKPKIVCFVGYYLPGYKAGGPLRTIANMVEQLSDYFEFWIITRDRDLGDSTAYEGVKIDQWCRCGSANVFYASNKTLSVRGISSIVIKIDCDAIYLNSFFDPALTIKPLIARHFGLIKKTPIIIAPRGEFSEGALSQKKIKKATYLFLTKKFGLYKNLIWQASSNFEKEDICRTMSKTAKTIKIASDLPKKPDNHILKHTHNIGQAICYKIVFLSRISPMKNLDYIIKVLEKVKRPCTFDIYGPIEDTNYWEKCKAMLKDMPLNINWNYCGLAQPEQVPHIFSRYELFFLPSQGENFAHVIAESLSVGTPVLVSDRTPWRDLENSGLGWDFSLSNPSVFSKKIDELIIAHESGKSLSRNEIINKFTNHISKSNSLQANIALFQETIQNHHL